jgi:hypothetical protein
MMMNPDDRKIQRKQNLDKKVDDKKNYTDEYRQYKKQKNEIKSKKEDLDQEDWEFWKEYYK